jgi:hypothetical protein
LKVEEIEVLDEWLQRDFDILTSLLRRNASRSPERRAGIARKDGVLGLCKRFRASEMKK